MSSDVPPRINDFVVKFANVNGSGSASANTLFAKSILRMGVPVSPRNIFPSNIQGLPTWYEVRVCEAGYLGRRGGVDLMVAMNPQTWDKDLAEIEAGGYLFYDSSKPLPKSRFREDVHTVGMPLTEICNRTYSDPRERQLFKNIIYVGALAALLGIDTSEVEKLIGEQYKGKERLLEPNIKALHLGRDYALEHLPRIELAVRRADAVGEKIFLEGNSAAALGAVYGGATVAAWYPITPSSSLAEAFARHCRKFRHDPDTGKARYAIVQAEDELASIGMVIGAGWNGARAFTATSGPGISLMQEFIGLAYFAEIPAVIFDVQRGGPSTGMPTRTQQADIAACAYASHGDTKHVLLLPEDPKECFEMGARAFDLADRLQTPVFVMLDLDIGMNERLCDPLTWDDAHRYDRGKVMTREELRQARISAATWTWTETASRTALIPAPTRRGARTSPVAPPRIATRATPRRDPTTSTTCSGFCASSRPRRNWCRRHACDGPRTPRAAASSTTARPARRCTRRSISSARRDFTSMRCACEPFPSATRSPNSSPTTTSCSWWNRTATRSFAACSSTSA